MAKHKRKSRAQVLFDLVEQFICLMQRAKGFDENLRQFKVWVKVQHSMFDSRQTSNIGNFKVNITLNMEASDNDIEVLSDTISSINILDENENPQKDDDIIVFSGKYFYLKI